MVIPLISQKPERDESNFSKFMNSEPYWDYKVDEWLSLQLVTMNSVSETARYCMIQKNSSMLEASFLPNDSNDHTIKIKFYHSLQFYFWDKDREKTSNSVKDFCEEAHKRKFNVRGNLIR